MRRAADPALDSRAAVHSLIAVCAAVTVFGPAEFEFEIFQGQLAVEEQFVHVPKQLHRRLTGQGQRRIAEPEPERDAGRIRRIDARGQRQ